MKSVDRVLLRGLVLAAVALQTSACGVLGDLFGGGGRDQDSEVERMVYVRGDEIHSSWLRTARLKVLQVEGSYGSPTWSPNGRSIAFLSVNSVALNDTLRVMNADGGNVRDLFVGDVGDRLLKWIPNGTRLQFLGGGTVLSADPSTGLVDTLGGAGSSTHLAWSPTGDRLFFSSPSSGSWDLGYFDVASRTVVDLDPDPLRKELHPSVSPDGSEVAYISERDNQSEIWVYTLSTNARRMVAPASVAQRAPVWSADGNRIAFTQGGQIYIVNADGTGLEQITQNAANYRLVDWSPLGTEIIYTANISPIRVVQNSVETYLLTLADRESLEVLDFGDDVNILWKN